MQPQTEEDYKKLLTQVIQKQMVILGPTITLVKARNVRGLTVSDEGVVTSMEGQPQALIQGLIDQFVQLSGLIVKQTMEPLLSGYSNNQTAPAPVAPSTPITTTPIKNTGGANA